MITTIDKAGRVVVPKAMREALDLGAGRRVEIVVDDGRLVIGPAPVAKRLDMRNRRPVLVADDTVPALTAAMVRDVVESVRR